MGRAAPAQPPCR